MSFPWVLTFLWIWACQRLSLWDKRTGHFLFQLFYLSLWYIIPVIRKLMHSAEVSTSLDSLVSQQPGLNCPPYSNWCFLFFFFLIFVNVQLFEWQDLGRDSGVDSLLQQLKKRHTFTLPPAPLFLCQAFLMLKHFENVTNSGWLYAISIHYITCLHT